MALFSYVDLEARVDKYHPLRTIRSVMNDALVPLHTSTGDFEMNKQTKILTLWESFA